MTNVDTTITGLGDARTALGDGVLGPEELTQALGFDPIDVLTRDERDAVRRVPADAATLERARRRGDMLVLRIPRTPAGPLTMIALAERLGGGLDPKVHKGVGYMLRDEWTIDAQPFATSDVCAARWAFVGRAPIPATCNRTYRAQDDVLAGDDRTPAHRRTAVEIAFDTLLWHRVRGERLLATTWDWSSSPSNDQGFAALGEFGEQGLGVIAYSRAVRFATLGVCGQR